ncbi:unnamed protein product [Boreogadus saida]
MASSAKRPKSDCETFSGYLHDVSPMKTAILHTDESISYSNPGGFNVLAIQSLSTRKESDQAVLTTTPSSVVTAIAGVGQPPALRLMTVNTVETLRRSVTGVKIVAEPRCSRCLTGQDNLAGEKSSTHRCQGCAILQRTAAYVITYSGLLFVVAGDGYERSMSLTNSAVSGFVRDNCLSCSAFDGPALDEMVFVMSELEVTVNAEGLVERFAPAVAQRQAVVQCVPGNVPDAEQASTSYARDFDPLGHDDDVEGLAEPCEAA